MFLVAINCKLDFCETNNYIESFAKKNCIFAAPIPHYVIARIRIHNIMRTLIWI